jgi:hypothetical protein
MIRGPRQAPSGDSRPDDNQPADSQPADKPVKSAACEAVAKKAEEMGDTIELLVTRIHELEVLISQVPPAEDPTPGHGTEIRLQLLRVSRNLSTHILIPIIVMTVYSQPSDGHTRPEGS